MDLREVAHLTGHGGVDGQGAAGNRRPNTRDNAAPKGRPGLTNVLPPISKPKVISYASELENVIEAIEKEEEGISPSTRVRAPSVSNVKAPETKAEFNYPPIPLSDELLMEKSKADLKKSHKNIEKELKLAEEIASPRPKGSMKVNFLENVDSASNGGGYSHRSSRKDSQNPYATGPTLFGVMLQESRAQQGALEQEVYNTVVKYLSLPEVGKLIKSGLAKYYISCKKESAGDPKSPLSSVVKNATKKGIVDSTARDHPLVESQTYNQIKRKSSYEVDSRIKKKSFTKIGPKVPAINWFDDGGGMKLLNEYLPIALFISIQLQHKEWITTLTDLYLKVNKNDKMFEASMWESDQLYLATLVSKLVSLEEDLLFKMMLTSLSSLNLMLTQKIMTELRPLGGRDDFQRLFFAMYLNMVSKEKIDSADKEAILSTELSLFSIETIPHEPKNSRAKVLLLCKSYIAYSADNRQLLEILSHLGVTKRHLVSLLIELKDEDRMISILNKKPDLMELVSVKELLLAKMYGPLVLFDSMELINIFNSYVIKSKRYTLYQNMCDMIAAGEKVETLCNIINHVSSTFWDMEKLRRFFNALRCTLSGKPSKWLVHIQNPLLFCMTLVYFFKKLRAQLDYRDKDILELTNEMLKFCQIYVESASEEALSINLFDKDGYGKGFLDYAFLVKEMDILETPQIEDLLFEMWDLGRHTMQTVTEFMRVFNARSKMRKFHFSCFTMDYSMPIEPGDNFQLDFCFTSNSAQVKVISEIFWPITAIVVEMAISLELLQMRLNNKFGDNWASNYFQQHRVLSLIGLFIRFSYTISCLIKTLAVKKLMHETHYIQVFSNLALAITFIQFVVYPLLFWDYFHMVSVLQMAYVLNIVAYTLFNALALNEIGVLLRIFFSMVFVVLIFGTVSFTIITAIAYTIHVLYIDFSQKAEGQIYSDFNLFSDLYQGIMTLFEFVFGAVVLYRPYLEWDFKVNSMTFIMTMFSFFGNIMMANMLVAFLTSAFDGITQNAKYLTMNMQYGLIKVFTRSKTDTLISMPYLLVPLALPLYLLLLY